ncbi:hypothetical protein D6853_14240 [Butyrivibrio sp. X503]|uniref:hypothetical protein n=1 Tax=Butyrivibrio sp. X503 TaxID=2364878 RepID=UPI000EA9BCCA|nr:hypothetical protein [Butyrivibrio sp. X503]RKM54094.1 hypothetical protein D6853_14240 [Butyrivibrio sp. X503]
MRRQRFVSKELARILLSAAMVFTPIVAGMTMQVDSYAAEESADDETKEVAMEASQENASEDASEAATEPAPEAVQESATESTPETTEEPAPETTAEPAPDAEQATVPESEPEAAPATGEYIEANYGKINTNYSTVGANDGTILNNNGLVFTNNAEIVNNDKNGVVGENNSRVISNNGVVGENKHDVIDNNNTVNNNRDRIINNNYYVELNDTDATVINNAGRVLCNAGYVGNNTDIIENNDKAVGNNSALIIANNGSVGENSGNIVENYSEATIVEEGAVQNNYTGGVVYGSTLDPDDARISSAVVANNRGGTVVSGAKSEDDLTIRNYYYGDLKNTVDTPDGEITCNGTIHITNKFGEKGDTDKDFVTVENRYNSVELYDADNTDVTYDNFVRDDVDYTQYIQTAKNGEPVEIAGTITLKAKDGYSLSDNGQLSGETDKIAYALSKNEDGSYTVNISSLTGDVALSPEMLNLIVSEISEDHGEVTDVVVDNGDTPSDGSAVNNVEKETVPNNPRNESVENIADNEVMETNRGYVNRNDGIINENADKSAVVKNNYGTIIDNNANVPFNFGKIENNYFFVINPTGTVVNNNEGGQVLGGRTGYAIDDEGNGDNFVIYNLGGEVISGGLPENNCVVVNYYSGAIRRYDEFMGAGYEDANAQHGTIHIINSFSDEELPEKEYLTVDYQYHSVEVEETENIVFDYSGFTQNGMDKKWYTETKSVSGETPIEGKITFRATPGHVLSDDGQLSGETDKYAYSLNKNEDGSYTVSFSSLTGNVSITLEDLHLKVSEDKDEAVAGTVGEKPMDSVSGGQSDTASVPGVENNGRGLVYSVNDGPRVYIPIEEKTRAPRGGSNAHSYKVLELGFGSITDLSVPVVKTLCEDGTLAKRCYFTYEGKLYALDIPVVDTSSPEYIEAIDALSKEKGKAAGFMRVAEIFEKVGFTVTEVAQ